MEFLKKLNWKVALKVGAIVLGALLIIAFSFKLITEIFDIDFSRGDKDMMVSDAVAPSYGRPEMYEESAKTFAAGSAGLSARNIGIPPIAPPTPQSPSGDDAESFEVTDYTATIESSDVLETCNLVTQLKARDYVIFENANQYENGCKYTFKVKKERVEEILNIVKSLDPKELNENTRTIKQLVDDFTSEVEILQKKKATIEATLESAVTAYDEITELATRNRDAESLAKIIDSKIQIIERLTQERIVISEQLDRISRVKAQELDKLEYTYFYLTVTENKFVDGESLKDSWKHAIQEFVDNLNELFQATMYLLYLFLVVVIAKYVWRWGKRIWKS